MLNEDIFRVYIYINFTYRSRRPKKCERDTTAPTMAHICISVNAFSVFTFVLSLCNIWIKAV